MLQPVSITHSRLLKLRAIIAAYFSKSTECKKIFCMGKTEKNEIGGASGAYGGGERCVQGSGGET